MKNNLKKAWCAVLFSAITITPVAMAESLSDQLRADALQELSNEYPEDGPFTRARDRSMQVGDIVYFTYESTGANGKINRFVRYKIRVSNTSNSGEIEGDILDKKVCENHREDSCN